MFHIVRSITARNRYLPSRAREVGRCLGRRSPKRIQSVRIRTSSEECGLHDGSQGTSIMSEPPPPTVETIAALGPWFHNLRLRGHQTAPRHFLGDYPAVFFERFAHIVPQNLNGWRVLDVGCNAGFYSFEMKRRGASHVVGLEVEPLYLRQARFAATQLGMTADVEFRE